METVRRNSLVPRCPPRACQRRLLILPVLLMLIFKCFPIQVGNFISYGVCKFICLSSFMYNRFHKELRFFFSLLKRKKEAKKEKSSHSTCIIRFKYHPKFPPTKIPRRGMQAACYPWADPPHKNLFAGEQDLSAIFINIHIN